MNQHATAIAEALEHAERTLRKHHRALVKLHAALAEGAKAHGDPVMAALAAAPKNPPDND